MDSVYLVISALEMQRRLNNPKYFSNIIKFFYSLRKEATHKPTKEAVAKYPLCRVYVIGTISFEECLLFHVIT